MRRVHCSYRYKLAEFSNFACATIKKFTSSISQEANEMCQKCLCKVLPDRGSSCLDGGSYYLNYNQCVNCQKKENIQVNDKTQHEDVDGVETVKYQHICASCGHVIAIHEYTFQIDEGYQEYEMCCELCGYGQDRISIMPEDPEKTRGEF